MIFSSILRKANSKILTGLLPYEAYSNSFTTLRMNILANTVFKRYFAKKEDNNKVTKIKNMTVSNVFTKLKNDKLKKLVFAEVRKGTIPGLRNLLERGGDVNARNSFEQTPLHFAVDAGNIPMAKELLEKKANPNVIDKFGRVPIQVAKYMNNFKMALLLQKNGAELYPKFEKENPMESTTATMANFKSRLYKSSDKSQPTSYWRNRRIVEIEELDKLTKPSNTITKEKSKTKKAPKKVTKKVGKDNTDQKQKKSSKKKGTTIK